MHILIFCLAGDPVAISLHDLLFQKGERELRLVSDAELAFATWLHQAGSDGEFFTRIRLSDGFIIEPAMIRMAVNRIPYFQMPHFINLADRSYAEMEMFALYISFLFSIKEKLPDGMPVKHINNADNALFFSAMALKAGMEVLENQFTSSPRWNQSKKLAAMDPRKKQNVSWHKHAPHLVWENKPVLFNEPFTNLVKADVVADKLFCPVSLAKQWQQKIKSFSQLIGRTVYQLTLAEVNGKYKFYSVNTRPAIIGGDALEAFSLLLIKNKS